MFHDMTLPRGHCVVYPTSSTTKTIFPEELHNFCSKEKMSLQDQLSSIPEMAFMHFMRAEDYESKESGLDYTILRVVVMTLAVVLLLQLMLHKLDSYATRKPLFKAVLEGVYEECK
jgi:hypothetical protein